MSFDYDRLVLLAQDNPADFEALRKELLEEKINEFLPEVQNSLRALQERINLRQQESRPAKEVIGDLQT